MIFTSINTYFKKQFTLLSSLRQRLLFATGLFVFSILFLYLFIPFNITEWIVYTSPFKKLQLPGLGLIVGVIIYISHLLQYLFFKKHTFRIYHLLLGFILDILMVSVPLSLLYSIPANSHWIEFKETVAIVLPLAVLYYILGLSLMTLWKSQNIKVDSNDVINKSTLNQITDRINIKDSNAQLRLSLKPEDLLYFESADNYVIVYFRKNERVAREMIRNSLKNMEQEFESFNCIRCHRSFIVNMYNVSSIKKDGRSYRIEIDGVSTPIPISRGYVKALQDHLNQ